MKRWKWSTSWALVLGLLLFVGGMILYTSMISNETDQAVSVSTAHDPEAGRTALIMQTQTAKMTADQQASVSNSSKNDQKLPREQNFNNFPSPVQGKLLRTIGNYYSEAFDNYLFHAGMDYAEPEGTMIRATHRGKVIFSGADPILGQKVTLDCGEGWLVTYGGLDNLRVQVGETVGAQDALGQVGFFADAESESAQPQLHYEVWHGDEVQRAVP